MAADDSQKKQVSTDDAIARAMERRRESVPVPEDRRVVQSGMEKVGVTPKRQKAVTLSEPAPEVEEEPTFFSRSREERAERARRAAMRVRRRDQDPAEQPAAEPAPPVMQPVEPAAEQPDPEPAPQSQVSPAEVSQPVPLHPVEPDPAPSPRRQPAPQPQKSETAERLQALSERFPAGKDPEPKADPAPEPDISAKAEPAAPKPAAEQPASTPEPSRPAPAAPTPAAKVSAKDAASGAVAGGVAALIERAGDQSAKRPSVEPAPEAPSKPKTKPKYRIKPGAASKVKAATDTGPAAPEPVAKQAPEKKPAPAAPDPAQTAEKHESQAYAAALQPPEPAQPAVEPSAEPDLSVYDPVVSPQPALKTARTKAFAPFEWMIASRYLRARKKEGFVSVIAGFSLVGIALGVATLIIVMAVMTGFRETLIEQIVGVNAHVNVTSQTENFENYDPLADAIREVDGVQTVTPLVQGQVLANSDRGHSGVIVRGMRPEDLKKLKVVTAPEVSQGSLDEFEGQNGVAIGTRLAAKLGLRVGDFITLISPDGDITPFSATPMPRSKNYKVLYTFQLGLYEYDSAFVYMPLEEAQIYFNKKDRIDSLEVTVADPGRPEAYVDPIRKAARRSIGVYTWKDLNGGLISALDIERKVMFVILTMIILVAALNIISGLVMLVKDKGRDVAIMRTMGMARGSILRIFFICGASIGVIGSIAGVILGVAFALNIGTIQKALESLTGASLWDPSVRMLSEVPAKLVPSDVLLTLFIALGLSFLATLYPAWKAAKLDPVEALRYE